MSHEVSVAARSEPLFTQAASSSSWEGRADSKEQAWGKLTISQRSPGHKRAVCAPSRTVCALSEDGPTKRAKLSKTGSVRNEAGSIHGQMVSREVNVPRY